MTKYWGGPWQWNDSNPAMASYVAPGGSFALVDLRNMETQSQGNHAGGVGNGLFATDDAVDLGSDYTLLGIGAHITEVIPEMGAASAWNSLFRVQPQGTYLVDYLAYTLTDGSDVDGIVSAKPLMPGSAPVNETVIHLAGHSVIWRNVVDVRGGNSKHAKNIRERHQKDLQKLFDTEANDDIWRKNLAALKEKTGQHWNDPDEDYLLTAKMKAQSKQNGTRANPHNTLYEETWPINGAITSSQDLGWSEYLGTFSVGSGRVGPTGNSWNDARMTTALASSDNTCYGPLNSISGDHLFGCLSRKDSSSTQTYYMVSYYKTSDTFGLHKVVAGSYTAFYSAAATLFAEDVMELTLRGSTIEGWWQGVMTHSQTDTAITSGVYAGITAYYNTGASALSSWVVDEAAAAGFPCGGFIGALGASSPFQNKFLRNFSLKRASQY